MACGPRLTSRGRRPARSRCCLRPAALREQRSASTRHLVAVDDEAQVLGHLVIELAARGIGGLRLPVDPLRASGSGLVIHALDERAPNALASVKELLGEAPLVGRPVTSYATNSEAARAYRGLAREVIELG